MSTKRVKQSFEIETSPEVMERIERLLALLHYSSAFGHSASFGMFLDGDGEDRVVVSPRPKYKNEVDITGGIGGDIEIAVNGGYTVKSLKDLGSYWHVKSVAGLFKDEELVKTIPRK